MPGPEGINAEATLNEEARKLIGERETDEASRDKISVEKIEKNIEDKGVLEGKEVRTPNELLVQILKYSPEDWRRRRVKERLGEVRYEYFNEMLSGETELTVDNEIKRNGGSEFVRRLGSAVLNKSNLFASGAFLAGGVLTGGLTWAALAPLIGGMVGRGIAELEESGRGKSRKLREKLALQYGEELFSLRKIAASVREKGISDDEANIRVKELADAVCQANEKAAAETLGEERERIKEIQVDIDELWEQIESNNAAWNKTRKNYTTIGGLAGVGVGVWTHWDQVVQWFIHLKINGLTWNGEQVANAGKHAITKIWQGGKWVKAFIYNPGDPMAPGAVEIAKNIYAHVLNEGFLGIAKGVLGNLWRPVVQAGSVLAAHRFGFEDKQAMKIKRGEADFERERWQDKVRNRLLGKKFVGTLPPTAPPPRVRTRFIDEEEGETEKPEPDEITSDSEGEGEEGEGEKIVPKQDEVWEVLDGKGGKRYVLIQNIAEDQVTAIGLENDMKKIDWDKKDDFDPEWFMKNAEYVGPYTGTPKEAKGEEGVEDKEKEVTPDDVRKSIDDFLDSMDVYEKLAKSAAREKMKMESGGTTLLLLDMAKDQGIKDRLYETVFAMYGGLYRDGLFDRPPLSKLGSNERENMLEGAVRYAHDAINKKWPVEEPETEVPREEKPEEPKKPEEKKPEEKPKPVEEKEKEKLEHVEQVEDAEKERVLGRTKVLGERFNGLTPTTEMLSKSDLGPEFKVNGQDTYFSKPYKTNTNIGEVSAAVVYVPDPDTTIDSAGYIAKSVLLAPVKNEWTMIDKVEVTEEKDEKNNITERVTGSWTHNIVGEFARGLNEINAKEDRLVSPRDAMLIFWAIPKRAEKAVPIEEPHTTEGTGQAPEATEGTKPEDLQAEIDELREEQQKNRQEIFEFIHEHLGGNLNAKLEDIPETDKTLREDFEKLQNRERELGDQINDLQKKIDEPRTTEGTGRGLEKPAEVLRPVEKAEADEILNNLVIDGQEYKGFVPSAENLRKENLQPKYFIDKERGYISDAVEYGENGKLVVAYRPLPDGKYKVSIMQYLPDEPEGKQWKEIKSVDTGDLDGGGESGGGVGSTEPLETPRPIIPLDGSFSGLEKEEEQKPEEKIKNLQAEVDSLKARAESLRYLTGSENELRAAEDRINDIDGEIKKLRGEKEERPGMAVFKEAFEGKREDTVKDAAENIAEVEIVQISDEERQKITERLDKYLQMTLEAIEFLRSFSPDSDPKKNFEQFKDYKLPSSPPSNFIEFLSIALYRGEESVAKREKQNAFTDEQKEKQRELNGNIVEIEKLLKEKITYKLVGEEFVGLTPSEALAKWFKEYQGAKDQPFLFIEKITDNKELDGKITAVIQPAFGFTGGERIQVHPNKETIILERGRYKESVAEEKLENKEGGAE